MNKVKSATTYLIIMSVTAILVVIFIVTNVLPVFAGSLKCLNTPNKTNQD
ncbi:MAG: hypothetical protein PHE70_05840 [Tepidanaerobacteraceae bacterium]|nr:hypothetical protein [Tepidanaerobacteraceae bacterium]